MLKLGAMNVSDDGAADGSLSGEVETDMVVDCEDGELSVLSYILSATSPVAERMLRSNMTEKQTKRVKSVFTCGDFNSFYRFIHPATARWEEFSPMNVGPVFRLSDFWQVDRLHSDCKKYLLGFEIEDHVTQRDCSQAAHRRSTMMSYVKTALDIADEYKETTISAFCKDLRKKATEVLCMLDVTLETCKLIKRYALEDPTRPASGNALYQDTMQKLSRKVVEIDADALYKEDPAMFVDLFKAVQRRQEEERKRELMSDEFESEQITNFLRYQFP